MVCNYCRASKKQFAFYIFSKAERCSMNQIKQIRARRQRYMQLARVNLHTASCRLYTILYLPCPYCTKTKTCFERMFHCTASFCPSFCIFIGWFSTCVTTCHTDSFFEICIQNLCLKTFFGSIMKMQQTFSSSVWYHVSYNIRRCHFLTSYILGFFEMTRNWIRWREQFDTLYVEAQNETRFIAFFFGHKFTKMVNSLRIYSESNFCSVFILAKRKSSISIQNQKRFVLFYSSNLLPSAIFCRQLLFFWGISSRQTWLHLFEEMFRCVCSQAVQLNSLSSTIFQSTERVFTMKSGSWC